MNTIATKHIPFNTINMKKVIITITPTGWETKIIINGVTIVDVHKRTPTGATTVGGSNIDGSPLVGELLKESLQGFFPYEVMEALNKI